MAKNSSLLSQLRPMNLIEEQEKFFFDTQYNPQFEYETDLDRDILETFAPLSYDNLPTAEFILNSVIKKYKDGEKYLDETQGKRINKTECETFLKKYLSENKLSNTISYTFSPDYISRTSVYKNTLKIKTPITYRENGFENILNHEIGTHVFRRQNDIKQPWYNKKSNKGFEQYLQTEEGLAVLNSQIPLNSSFLFYPALNYYAVCKAQTLSFSELFADLKNFVSDKQKRFTICLKVKRGITDTSKPGSFTRNQIYLTGAIEVAQWLEENDYAVELLYVGKISTNDIGKAWDMSNVSISELELPLFIKNKELYKSIIRETIKTNRLPVKII